MISGSSHCIAPPQWLEIVPYTAVQWHLCSQAPGPRHAHYIIDGIDALRPERKRRKPQTLEGERLLRHHDKALQLLLRGQSPPPLAAAIQKGAVQPYRQIHALHKQLQQARGREVGCGRDRAARWGREARQAAGRRACRSRLPRCSSDSCSSLQPLSTLSRTNSLSSHGMAAAAALSSTGACRATP